MTQQTFSVTEAAKKSKWIEDTKGYIKKFFHVGQKFTADKLHDIFGEPPKTCYWGSLAAALQDDGFVKPTGRRIASKRPKANARKQEEWEVVK